VDVRFPGVAVGARALSSAINGFALEPSWLAHQLNMLYLPLWLACTWKKYTSHRFHFGFLTFENLLLIGGIGALLLTLSRVGVAAFFLALLIIIIQAHGKVVLAIRHAFAKRSGKKVSSKLISWLLIAVYLLFVFGVVFAFTKIDPRMKNLFKFSFAQDNQLLRFFNELKFGDRVIYWLTGWNIFNAYPFLGVGLGNAGFYFCKYLPAYGWSLVEVENLLNRTMILLNIKSLWLRLLAETGMVGFSLFIGWLLSLIPAFIDKIRSNNRTMETLGLIAVSCWRLWFWKDSASILSQCLIGGSHSAWRLRRSKTLENSGENN
jgi:O-antigen ligase